MIDRRGKIESVKNKNKCLAIRDLDPIDDVAFKQQVIVKNTYSDKMHIKEEAVDNSEESYWLSGPNSEKSSIIVMFDLPRSF